MLLAIDMGNTQTAMGLFDGDELVQSWRMPTDRSYTADEIHVRLMGFFKMYGLSLDAVDAIAFAGVVPQLSREWHAVADRIAADAIVIGPQTAAVTKLRAARPQAVGADRVANAVAAETFYGAPAIVVDFGTATNIDVIDEDGYYIGGAIAPGIRISMDALAARAAKLASVPLEAPEHAIGRDTEECIKVGAVTGAAAMAVVLLCITLLMFAVQKYYLEAKTAATLTGKASRARMLIEDKSVKVPLTILCALAAGFVILMYLCVPIGACFPTWGFKFFPLTGKWFGLVFTRYHGLQAFRDSFVLSLISAPITALLSMIISYLVVKRKFKAKGFIEAVSMLAMAVPGTVLGVGYIRGFASGVFNTGFLQGLYGTGLILIIVFVVRSLPTGTRSGISALRQIDKSIEESAYDMGADSLKVFMTVTLPLIKDSFLSGLVTAFVRSITAISAIILLVTPQFLLITVQINEFAEKGSYSLACAFATILIVITYGAVLLMNLFIKHFGTSKNMKEDQ